MIFSMTGYASLEKDCVSGILVAELRAVNNRYLDLQLKCDDGLRGFEPLVREVVAAKMVRGKVECRLTLIQQLETGTATSLNAEVLASLKQLSAVVQREFPESTTLSIAEILRWPGVVTGQDTQIGVMAEEIRETIALAVDELNQSRAREGAKLKAVILERLAEIEQLVMNVKRLIPAQIKAYEEKLGAKLQETLKSIDPERIVQEIVLFAQRIDVDEELTRLIAHVGEVRRILDADQAAGKRLDFLMQELNREANTLGSKSVSVEVTKAAVELKVLIEQMREQVQNIE